MNAMRRLRSMLPVIPIPAKMLQTPPPPPPRTILLRRSFLRPPVMFKLPFHVASFSTKIRRIDFLGKCFRCNVCTKRFVSRKALYDHYRDKNGVHTRYLKKYGDNHCKGCGLFFPTEEEVEYHKLHCVIRGFETIAEWERAMKVHYEETGLKAEQLFFKAIDYKTVTATHVTAVAQLLEKVKDVDEVNNKLDQMGVEIGHWLIHEHLMRVHWDAFHSRDFKKTTEMVVKAGCKLFVEASTPVFKWDKNETVCLITLSKNPFFDFPQSYKGVRYCNIFVGMLRRGIEEGLLLAHVSCVGEEIQERPLVVQVSQTWAP